MTLDDGGGPGAGPRCSFCGRSQLEVHRLIAGANAHICDACIMGFMETVRGAGAAGPRIGGGSKEPNPGPREESD